MFEGAPKPNTRKENYSKAESSFAELARDAREIIDEIEIETIDSLFKAERERSGVEAKNSKVVVFFDDTGPLGQYFDGTVALNPRKIFEYAEKIGVSFRQNLVSTFIHECTHAQGYNSKIVHPTPLTLFKSLLVRQDTGHSGYTQDYIQGMLPKRSFSLFNEGVTDSIAAEIQTLYSTQTGDASLREYTNGAVYVEQRALIASFVSLLAHKTDLPEELVWRSIKQGYFNGQDLADSEMGKLFDTLVIKKIVEEISELDLKKEKNIATKKLTEKIIFSSNDQLPQESVERINEDFARFTEVN